MPKDHEIRRNERGSGSLDLPGNCPEAVRERFAALEAFENIGEIYYTRWLETGEILPEAAEYCLEAKQYLEAAQRLQAEHDTTMKEET